MEEPNPKQRATRHEAAPARRFVGPVVILVLAFASAVVYAAWPVRRPPGFHVWTFARLHHQIYVPIAEQWNLTHTPKVNLTLLSLPALEQRMLSAFLARTTSAELIEVERRAAARAFAGPLDAVGFVDLTDRIRAEKLDINPASFSPWTARGRIFGLPHDVHPVMLGYRADLVEAAGIDVSRIETWDDFFNVLRPLMDERDEEGLPKHYLLNFWDTPVHGEVVELLILQAGGALFDERGQPTLDRATNAHVLATLVSWRVGPRRVVADAPYFSASGNKLLLEGRVVASFVPDWMCNIWRFEIPQLAGKVKLMPLPAWARGGRRTSVWGGTMLGISRSATDIDGLWTFAKRLYLSRDAAHELYTRGDIITPVRSFWDDPIYDKPDPFFSGQAKGRAYIDLASQVPIRSNSPYGTLAMTEVQNALIALVAYAQRSKRYAADQLTGEAARLLGLAQARVAARVARNVFLAAEPLSADVRESTP